MSGIGGERRIALGIAHLAAVEPHAQRLRAPAHLGVGPQ